MAASSLFLSFHVKNVSTALGRICRYARVHRFPYDAHPTLDRGSDHYHELGDLYISIIAPFFILH